ncbi:MAG: DUF2806 domain-containing protein [Alphaproteobacteria bacterium]|jgi:hypothetical protein|nr:DUF2806 domain-containing protein [Alphaproteobacteria bacterium]
MAKKADKLEALEKPDASESKDILPINVTDLLGVKGSVGIWGVKIIENFSKAVGFVFKDMTQVGRAKREAEAKSILAKVDTDSEMNLFRELAKVKREVLLEDQDMLGSVKGRAIIRDFSDKERQQENLESILREALEFSQTHENSADPKLSEKEINDDWMSEFVDLAKNTSEERMRKVWGRVLANETAEPGSFSMRSLFILKTMSYEDAMAFQRMCQLKIEAIDILKTNSDWFASSETDFFGTNYNDFLRCSFCGLISSNSTAQKIIRYDDENCIDLDYGDVSIHIRNDSKIDMKVDVVLFTPFGNELYSLVDVNKNIGYIESIVEYFEKFDLEIEVK